MYRIPKSSCPTTLMPQSAPASTGFGTTPRVPIMNTLVPMTIAVFVLILLAPPTGRYY